MAQGFAQGFTSGFGLVSDIFKEKRQAEAQEKQMAFQREQFEEQKRRSDATEARLNEAQQLQKEAALRAEAAEKRQADEYARNADMEQVRMDLMSGSPKAIERLLVHPKAGPEIMSQLDPEYRSLMESLSSGQLDISKVDKQKANLLFSSELRRGVGQEATVNMNPAETDPSKADRRKVTVTNKSIESVNPVEGNPNLLSINLLVEGIDSNGRKVLFKDKFTAGRTVGGDEKNIPVRNLVDYVAVGKLSMYNLIKSSPAIRNLASAYGVGMTPEQRGRLVDFARSKYSEELTSEQKRLESMKSSDPDRFEKIYGEATPYEAAIESTKGKFHGMNMEQYVSTTIQRLESPSDAQQISRSVDLDQTQAEYSAVGMDIKNSDEAIRMKNDEFAISAKYGNDAVPIIKSMVQTYASRKGGPITFDEYRQLTREIASMKTPLTPDNFQGVIGQAVNRLVRGEGGQTVQDQRAGNIADVGASAAIAGSPFIPFFGLPEMPNSTQKKTEPAVTNDVASIAPAKYVNQINTAASNAGIDPTVLARIAKTESNFRNDIISGKTVSSANAVGIVQMVPKWHPDVDFNRVKTDTQYALNEGASYFRELLDRFGGDYEKAAAAYNWGPTNLTKLLNDRNKAANWKKHLPNETKNYLKSVLG